MAETKDNKFKEYFIALIPPPPIYDDALKLKHYFFENYQAKAALNSPPHITLHMPFRWKEPKDSELILKLKAFVKAYEPIKVCLDNFSSFPPRVIFINVAASEMLNDFQKNLQRFL